MHPNSKERRNLSILPLQQLTVAWNSISLNSAILTLVEPEEEKNEAVVIKSAKSKISEYFNRFTYRQASVKGTKANTKTRWEQVESKTDPTILDAKW